MLDIIGWLLEINRSTNLRAELEQMRAQQVKAAPISLAAKVSILERENEFLKLRLGILIRLLAENGAINVQKYVATFEELRPKQTKAHKS